MFFKKIIEKNFLMKKKHTKARLYGQYPPGGTPKSTKYYRKTREKSAKVNEDSLDDIQNELNEMISTPPNETAFSELEEDFVETEEFIHLLHERTITVNDDTNSQKQPKHLDVFPQIEEFMTAQELCNINHQSKRNFVDVNKLLYKGMLFDY
jgi:hypothetical protein